MERSCDLHGFCCLQLSVIPCLYPLSDQAVGMTHLVPQKGKCPQPPCDSVLCLQAAWVGQHIGHISCWPRRYSPCSAGQVLGQMQRREVRPDLSTFQAPWASALTMRSPDKGNTLDGQIALAVWSTAYVKVKPVHPRFCHPSSAKVAFGGGDLFATIGKIILRVPHV